MFDKQWFQKWQPVLLWLCNTPLISTWFRWILRINGERSSVGKNEILKILPNGIFWKDSKNKKRVYNFELRTHNKFSKRLYFVFKPLWQVAHWWDTLFANNLIPTWNLGFDTFPGEPLYPAAGAASPVDGQVKRETVDETLATIRAGAGNGALPASTDMAAYLAASTTTNQFQRLIRNIMCWDTSGLGAGATVNTAIISLRGIGKLADIGSPITHIVASTPAATNNLVNADYAQLGATSFANIAYASFSTVAYNDFTLDANGKANINVSGISKFGAITDWDLNNSFTGSWVSGQVSFTQWSAADEAGTTQDPKLTGTYTPASAGGGISGYKSLLGVGQA